MVEKIIKIPRKTLGINGIHTFKKALINSLEMIKIEESIKEFLNVDPEKAKFYIDKLNKSFFYKKVYHNIVVDSGLEVMARILSNNGYTGNGYINYGALGNGTSTPSSSDTELDNETYRSVITVYGRVGKVAQITQFYNSSEANTQHYEAGEFIDGTVTANSGILFSRWLINENKTSLETLTIESEYTFKN